VNVLKCWLLNDVCSYGALIHIRVCIYSLCVCVCACVRARARLLHMRMSFCRVKCCFATDSVDAIAARKTRTWPNQFSVVSIEYLTTNRRNTVRFLKFRKSLEYFECMFCKITWSVVWIKNETYIHIIYTIPPYICGRLSVKSALLRSWTIIIIANTEGIIYSECSPSVIVIFYWYNYDVRMCIRFCMSPMQFLLNNDHTYIGSAAGELKQTILHNRCTMRFPWCPTGMCGQFSSKPKNYYNVWEFNYLITTHNVSTVHTSRLSYSISYSYIK